MKCLVIGYGSIGARHAAILRQLAGDVSIVSRKAVGNYAVYKGVTEAFQNQTFEYVIIANRTCDHYDSLKELIDLGYDGLLLVEKPVFERTRFLPQLDDNNVFVGANLRFHPVIQELRGLLEGRGICSFQAYAGQYLPDWRPGLDYSLCYSGSKKSGGGVLRDLCHELDYIIWLCGSWKRVAALGGKFSSLKIDSDDAYSLLIETEKCPVVSLQLNYLDKKSRREIIVNLDDSTIKADLINNTVTINSEVKKFVTDRNGPFIMQHEAVLGGDIKNLCTFKNGIAVLELIEASEKAAQQMKWVIN